MTTNENILDKINRLKDESESEEIFDRVLERIKRHKEERAKRQKQKIINWVIYLGSLFSIFRVFNRL